MQDSLTQRQREIVEYLKSAQRKTGVMPSTRELQHYFGFASQTAAMSHLRALERKGVIQRLPGKARAVVFPEELDREEIVDIPVYGQIAAGMAQDVESEREGCISIDIASIGIPRSARTFALKVRGDSMIDAHIDEGDLAVLDVAVLVHRHSSSGSARMSSSDRPARRRPSTVKAILVAMWPASSGGSGSCR